MIMNLLANGPFDVTLFIVFAIVAGMIIVQVTSRDDGGVHRPALSRLYPLWLAGRWPGLFPASLTALDAAGRLLHIRWPCWLIEWAWDRQATPGPEELLRRAKPRHRARKTARGIYGDVRAHLREDETEAGRHAEVKG